MDLRKIRRHEVPEVLKLIDEFYRQPPPWPDKDELDQIFETLQNSGGCIVGAFIKSYLVGTCTVNVCPNLSWSGRPYAILENVIVSKIYRNKGIGKAVLNYSKTYAETLGCFKVALMTGSTEPSTLNFYRSLGFIGDKTGFQLRLQT